MSKDLDKFKKEYASLKPKIQKFSLENGEKLSKVQDIASANCRQGESYVTSMIVEARKKGGVQGDKLADFSKYKGFAEALQLFGKSVKAHSTALANALAHEAGAKDVHAKVSKLRKEMEKSLLKNKKSADKKAQKEITDIYDEIFQQEGYLAQSAEECAGISKEWIDYEKNSKNTILKLLGDAPDYAQNADTAVTFKHDFSEKVMDKRTRQCVTGAKAAKKLCDDALATFSTDKRKAMSAIKTAAELLGKIKQTYEFYADLRKKKDRTISSADKKELTRIEKSLSLMKDAYENTERAVRGVSTTLRKGERP